MKMGSHLFKHEKTSQRRNSSPSSYVTNGQLHTQNDSKSLGSERAKSKVMTKEL